MARKLRIVRILAYLVCTTLYCLQLSAQRCEVERWAVKTGTDAGAGSVDLANPQNTTIAQLIGLVPPHPIPNDTRFVVIEVDITRSEAVRGPDGKSEFQKNIEAVPIGAGDRSGGVL